MIMDHTIEDQLSAQARARIDEIRKHGPRRHALRTAILRFIYYLALAGIIISAVTTLLAAAGVDLWSLCPLSMALVPATFIVWFPAILEAIKKQRDQIPSPGGIANPYATLGIYFKDTPAWLGFVALISFVFALINFCAFLAQQPGSPTIKNGQFILEDHGQFVRTITEEEYHRYQANGASAVSGYALAFFAVGAALLAPPREGKESPMHPNH